MKLKYFVILGIILGFVVPPLLSELSTGKEAALLNSFPDEISETVHPIILTTFIILLVASISLFLLKKGVTYFFFVICLGSFWYKWLARTIQSIGIPISTSYSPDLTHSTLTRWPSYILGTKILDYGIILFVIISLFALFSKRFSNFERRFAGINVGFIIGYILFLLFFVLPSMGY